MSFVLDIILIAIIVLTALISAKYGFVRTLIEFVGFIVIVLIAGSVSVPIAESIYDAKIQNEVMKYTAKLNIKAEMPADDFFDSLPDYLKKEGGLFSIDKETIEKSFNDNLKSGEKIVETVNNDVIKPAVVKILSVVISAIIFAILSVVVHIVSRLANNAVKHTFAKSLNEKLGFAIGVLKGIIICVIICTVLIAYFDNIKKGFGILNAETVNKSYFVLLVRNVMPNFGIFSYII